ncbi:MAG: helix-turn-helix transcriptional regulator [Pseudomonadota bacterium]
MGLEASSESNSAAELTEGSPRSDSAFLAQLGERVRGARGQRGLSRKRLAQLAGVSERYLAQLETGRGNISILLLRHITEALELSLEEIVADRDTAGDIALIVQMLRRASGAQRGQAKAAITEILQTAKGPAKARRIALIGLRGAGKSTLGQLVAGDLGIPFVELNSEISNMSGLAVPEIFNLYGPEGYRRLERRCLQQVVDTQDRVVLATGGGIVTDPSTYDLLLESFFTVWLHATPEEHMERVRAQGDLRPMAGNPEAMDELKLILGSREALYRRADRAFDTAGRPVGICRRSLLDLLRQDGFQVPQN